MDLERAIPYTEKKFKKLYEGTAENLHSIDSTTIYKDKKDLMTSLKALIQKNNKVLKLSCICGY